MKTYRVTVKNGGNFTNRTVEARNALSACKKAARHGGFTARDVASAYVEQDARMTFFSIRPGISYSVFNDDAPA
ncbi:hypothetical protein [Agromyces larvae]|uniref:Uncharacterized protein n=1 Tax=Agromyces larvae TaxID=2929802 RepID=A0ABY4C3A3_9MICO|nr:hypothetical protein [Agromyces larvae]UOE45950.1 hypothetical protein MTO99_09475 [Agromyces larvae]